MIEKFKVNERIRKKIEDSDLKKPIKDFLLKALEIEGEVGRFGPRYSNLYIAEIDKTYILLGEK